MGCGVFVPFPPILPHRNQFAILVDYDGSNWNFTSLTR
jgi:hypothetical protein